MARVRVSTTVDEALLAEARGVHAGTRDSILIDAALRAFLADHHAARIDAEYVAYDAHPLDEPDEWGDLAAFRDAAGAT